MKPLLCLCFLSFAFFASDSHSNEPDCSSLTECNSLGEQEGRDGNLDKAEAFLKKALDYGETYKSRYLLGHVYLQKKNLENAYFEFNSAYSLTSSDSAKSSAIAMQALVKFEQNQFYDASSLIRAARDLIRERPKWIEELAIKIDTKKISQVPSSDEINRALSLSARFVLIGAPAKIDLNLNFRYDSDQLEPSSLKLLPELKESLKKYRGKTLTVIGHTDTQGSDEYNLRLSELRANALKRMLSSEANKLNITVLTEGRGEYEPLYNGQTESIHRLNRRVEINVK